MQKHFWYSLKGYGVSTGDGGNSGVGEGGEGKEGDGEGGEGGGLQSMPNILHKVKSVQMEPKALSTCM